MTAFDATNDGGAAPPGRLTSIAQRLDRLPLTRLHLGIFTLCTLGLAADIGEVALSNVFSAIFLAPPYGASPLLRMGGIAGRSANHPAPHPSFSPHAGRRSSGRPAPMR